MEVPPPPPPPLLPPRVGEDRVEPVAPAPAPTAPFVGDFKPPGEEVEEEEEEEAPGAPPAPPAPALGEEKLGSSRATAPQKICGGA